MKRDYKDNTKVFFSVNAKINNDFEKYCDNNYMNKSKIIEGLMNLLIEKSTEVTELLKRLK
jgi:hypothetical protein